MNSLANKLMNIQCQIFEKEIGEHQGRPQDFFMGGGGGA